MGVVYLQLFHDWLSAKFDFWQCHLDVKDHCHITWVWPWMASVRSWVQTLIPSKPINIGKVSKSAYVSIHLASLCLLNDPRLTNPHSTPLWFPWLFTQTPKKVSQLLFNQALFCSIERQTVLARRAEQSIRPVSKQSLILGRVKILDSKAYHGISQPLGQLEVDPFWIQVCLWFWVPCKFDLHSQICEMLVWPSLSKRKKSLDQIFNCVVNPSSNISIEDFLHSTMMKIWNKIR